MDTGLGECLGAVLRAHSAAPAVGQAAAGTGARSAADPYTGRQIRSLCRVAVPGMVCATTSQDAAPGPSGATLALVPRTRPRYGITDTGAVRDLLDDAERRWPEVTDRKELLLRLARAGHDSLGLSQAAAARRRERQRDALERLPELVDRDALLADEAWR